MTTLTSSSSSDSDSKDGNDIVSHNGEELISATNQSSTTMTDDKREIPATIENDVEVEKGDEARCWCSQMSEARIISLVIASTDTLASFAAGMSIRYFPIFFMNTLFLRPTQVQILYIVAPLGQIVVAHYAQVASKVYGRCQVTVFCKLIGIAFMVSMILSYQLIPTGESSPLRVIVTCILYTIRTIFMNCTQGLTKSVLMDAVPRKERGKWSSLESFNTASWSGSSFIGGILVDSYGVSVNFYVTAALQFLSTLPLMLLFNKVAPEGMKSSSSSISCKDIEEEAGGRAKI